MKASILPTSQGNSQRISIKYADITQYFFKMGLWEHRAVYPCARDMNSRIASEKLSRMWICGFILPLSQNIKKICDYDIFSRAWIYGFILPLSQYIIKNTGLRELTILDCSEKAGSLGGSHA